MASQDLNSLFAASRARQLIYGQNPTIDPNATSAAMQQTANQLADVAPPPPIQNAPPQGNVQSFQQQNQDQTPNPQINSQSQVPQQTDQVNVNAQAQQVPYSPIDRNLPPSVTDPNFIPPPQAATLTPEQQKNVDIRKQAIPYQEPSKVRKFFGNALTIGGDLAGIATGNRMIPALASKGAGYIEHEPYLQQLRRQNSQIQNAANVAATQEEQNKNLADINAKNFGAYAQAQRGLAEQKRGEAEIQNAQTKARIASDPYLALKAQHQQELQVLKSRANAGGQFKYTDANGTEGIGVIQETLNPDTHVPELQMLDIGTGKQVIPIKSIPIDKTMESREGTGSIPNQIYREQRAGNTDNVNKLEDIQRNTAKVSAEAAAAARGINPQVAADTNLARKQEAQAGAVEAGYKAQDLGNIHNNAQYHLEQAINNPLYLNDPHNISNPAVEQKVRQNFTQATGVGAPQKLGTQEIETLGNSSRTIQAVNNLRRNLSDPEIQDKVIGPVRGRETSLQAALGGNIIQGLTPAGQSKATEILGDINILRTNEASILGGGRGVVSLLKAIEEGAPSTHFDTNQMAGSLKAIEDKANQNILSIKNKQYGSYNNSDVTLNAQGHIIPKFKLFGSGKIAVYNPNTRAYDIKELKVQ